MKWFAIPFSSRSHSVLLELTPPKDVLFIKGNWNAKVGSQETPGVTGKFGLGIWNEAGQGLIEICQENAMVIANTLFQQHKRRLYTWTLPDGQHRDQRWRPRRATPRLRSGAAAERSNHTSKEQWLHGCRRAKRSYCTFKVRRGGGEEIALIQGKEQWLHFAGAAVKRYPTPKVRETQVRW